MALEAPGKEQGFRPEATLWFHGCPSASSNGPTRSWPETWFASALE